MNLWGAGDTAIIETIDLCFPRYDQLRRNNDISVLFWPIHSEGNLFWVTGGLQGTSGPMRGWDQGWCREADHFFVRRALLGCTSDFFFFSFEVFKQVWSSAGFAVGKENLIISFAFLPGANFDHGKEFNICGLKCSSGSMFRSESHPVLVTEPSPHLTVMQCYTSETKLTALTWSTEVVSHSCYCGYSLCTTVTHACCSADLVNDRQHALLYIGYAVGWFNTHAYIHTYIKGPPEKFLQTQMCVEAS